MNLSIGAAAKSYLSIPTARVAPEATSAGGGGKPAASFDDDWCPTRPPVPPRPHVEIHSQLESLVGGDLNYKLVRRRRSEA